MIVEYFELFSQMVQQQNIFVAAIYMILAKTLGGAVFLPGAPLTVLSGVIFGTFWGTIVSLIGNMGGALISFFIARYMFKDFVQNKILKKYPNINKYEDRLFSRGLQTVILLRLMPIFPYNVLNFALAVTDVKLKDFFWGSLIGMIPATIAFVYFGHSVKIFSFINILFALIAIFGLTYLGKFLSKKSK